MTWMIKGCLPCALPAIPTGFTCAAATNLFLDGRFGEHGVFLPEVVGSRSGNLTYVLDYLRVRNVVYRKEVREG